MLVIAATAAELAFVERAETLCCGIGPVEAAAATARALRGSSPTAVIHIGIAGARTLAAPSLVIGSDSLYCDVIDPTSSLARIERQAPDAHLLAISRATLPHAHVLPIGTSGRVGGGSCCDVEAMEGFGVLRAAALAGVPAIELRAISNAVGESERRNWRIQEALALLAKALPPLLEGLDA